MRCRIADEKGVTLDGDDELGEVAVADDLAELLLGDEHAGGRPAGLLCAIWLLGTKVLSGQDAGVWGGLSEDERRARVRRRRACVGHGHEPDDL